MEWYRTDFLSLSTSISCAEVGAAIAVKPFPRMPHSDASTVRAQVTKYVVTSPSFDMS